MLNPVFLPYKGKHSGQSAVVFGTSASLHLYKPLPEPIVKIGVNRVLYHPTIKMDYFFFGDDISYQTNLTEAVKFAHIKHFSKEQVEAKGFLPYHLTVDQDFHGANIAEYPVVNHSIIFSAMSFAVYAGFTSIFVVGCDGYNTGSWMVGYEYSLTVREACDRIMSDVWKIFTNMVKEYYPQVKIIAVNPSGIMRGRFEEIYQCAPYPLG